eukprot:6491537-Amphidinium_carterae.2
MSAPAKKRILLVGADGGQPKLKFSKATSSQAPLPLGDGLAPGAGSQEAQPRLGLEENGTQAFLRSLLCNIPHAMWFHMVEVSAQMELACAFMEDGAAEGHEADPLVKVSPDARGEVNPVPAGDINPDAQEEVNHIAVNPAVCGEVNPLREVNPEVCGEASCIGKVNPNGFMRTVESAVEKTTLLQNSALSTHVFV